MYSKLLLKSKGYARSLTGLLFAVAVIGMCASSIARWPQVQAAQVSDSHSIGVSAVVGGVNPGPVDSGGSSGSVPTPTKKPTITIIAEPKGQVPQQGSAYVFTGIKPAFSGTTSVPNGLIFLQITGPNSLNSTVQADGQGNWFWQAPLVLPSGSYTIVATVYDSFDLTRFASVRANFIVQPAQSPDGSNEGQPSEQPSFPSVPPTNGGNQQFGVFLQISDEYKYVIAGNPIVGLVSLITNSGQAVANQDILYTIISPTGEVILQSTDTMQFSKQLRFLKTFTTAPNTLVGEYTVQVTSTYKGITSVASDTFHLIPPPTGSGVKIPMIVLFGSSFLIACILFALFAIILYFIAWRKRKAKQIQNRS